MRILLVAIFVLVGCSDSSSNNANNVNNTNNTNVSNNSNNVNNTNNSNNTNNQNNTNNTNNTNMTQGCTTGLGPDRDFDGITDAIDPDPSDPFDFLPWSAQGSTVHAESQVPQFIGSSWDGRILFGSTQAGGEFTVSAVRPEMVSATPNNASFSTPVAFSPAGSGDVAIFADQSHLPDPTSPNPFASDQTGAPMVDGTYSTYKVGMIGTISSPANSPSPLQLSLNYGTVVVDTATHEITSATIDGTATPLQSINNDGLWSAQPTVSHDGRLIVWSGLPQNQFEGRALLYSFNPDPMVATGWSAPLNIAAMYDTDGAGAANETDVDGVPFSDRYPIAQLPMRDPDGALLNAMNLILGSSPRLSRDASELLFSSIATFEGDFHSGVLAIGVRTNWSFLHIDGAINPSRSTLSDSGDIMAPGSPQLDALQGSYNLHTLSDGSAIGVGGYSRASSALWFLSGSMWTPFLGNVDVPLPRTGQPDTYGIVTGSGRYVEVPLLESIDQHYVLSLPMNEQIVFDNTVLSQIENGSIATGAPFRQALRQAVQYDSTETPDVSGNRHHARLLNGAAFPFEYHDAQTTWNAYWVARLNDPNLAPAADGVAGDVIEGVKGNAVFFPGAASVETDLTFELPRFVGDMTVQFWVKPLQLVPAQLTSFAQIVVSNDANGNVSVTAGNNTITSTTTLQNDAWNLVTVTFSEDTMELAVNDGVDSLVLADPVIPNGGLVSIGPADIAATASAIYLIDEFSISDVARTPVERRIAGFARRGLPTLRGSDFGAPAPFDVLPAYAPRDEVATSEFVDLGEALFNSMLLSDDRSMSCATCHDSEKGFADNETTAIGVFGRSNDRNSQTVYNRMFSTAQFWDGRAASTEAQSLGPIQAETEMNLPLPEAIERVNQDPEFLPLFEAAFGSMCVDRERMARAIGAYVRTIVSPTTTAFDLGQMNAQQRLGETLFFGKARCSSCHHGPNFTDERFHNPGFDVVIESDEGRSLITGRMGDLAKFKTPTLRELTHTGPYFHNGSFDGLEQVVSFYNQGGVTTVNRDVSVRPLGLTMAEEAAIVAFLEALSSP